MLFGKRAAVAATTALEKCFPNHCDDAAVIEWLVSLQNSGLEEH